MLESKAQEHGQELHKSSQGFSSGIHRADANQGPWGVGCKLLRAQKCGAYALNSSSLLRGFSRPCLPLIVQARTEEMHRVYTGNPQLRFKIAGGSQLNFLGFKIVGG